ncbi:hypothetical protein H9Y04_36055 [Streptomyces sp. TRM66268-LWL]|uniref:Lipoprotein CseA n=1 Tax=Streptomyces polyasparticus TaxID=2767826 RepID=A0ABR7SR27_9ACTN|nr:hypothetical protein [Streptomyces polyasparticus]MBC9717960.1 hypothetical protein [Streptomyces polyasparticus]
MAGGAASAGLAALALCVVALTACGTGAGGTRDEGAARVGDATPKATVSPSPSPSLKGTRLTQVQAVALVKDDPTVNARVRADLKPCFEDTYPVDVSYGNLTGGSSEDIMVNVMTCGDGIGMGSYVYRAEGRKYQNVFKAEEPPVYAEMNRGDLIVYQQLYDAGDPVALPSSEDVITYRWKDGRFVETDRMHNDYSSAVNGPDAAAAPEEN